MHKWVQKVVGWIADALIEKITDPIDDLGKRIDKMSDRIDKLERLHDQDAAAKECDLSMMDDRICYLISMCAKRGYTTADERRRVTRMHDAYRARGGNHGEENEYAMFCELPSQEEYEESTGGNKMKTIDWKDVMIRAIKTFMEAFFAFAGAELAGMDLFSIGKDMWCAVGISAAAAGISAVWNGMIEPALNALTKKE